MLRPQYITSAVGWEGKSANEKRGNMLFLAFFMS